MSDISDAVGEYLKEGGIAAIKSKAEEAKKKKEKASQERVAEIEQSATVNHAKGQVKHYLALFDSYSNQIANYKVDSWNKCNEFRKEIKDDKDKLDKSIADEEADLQKKINDLITSHATDIYDYILNLKIINEEDTTTFDDVKMMIITNGENQFDEQKKKAQDLLKKLTGTKIKLNTNFSLDSYLKFDADEISEKIAELPITIEDKIQEIKDLLDTILGRLVVKTMNPDLPEFDIDVLIAMLKSSLEPLLNCISPLEAVGGKIPIIGDLIAILSMMSSQAAPKKLTKEDIKKLVPKKPEIPQGLWDNIKGIGDDVLTVCMQLPMMLINVIFAMINVIYSKLKIITSIIPLGSFFPLTLIDSAIEAVPKILAFIKDAPIMMFMIAKGMVKDKLAEAMALSIPTPNISMDLLESMIPEVEDTEADKPSTKSKPEEKKKDYADVNAEFLPSVKDNGYTKVDLARVLSSYKKIYDGSNTPINMYTVTLPKTSDQDPVVKKSVITRTVATPDEYKAKLTEVFSKSAEEQKEGVNFEKITKPQSVVGGDFALYEDYINSKEPGPNIVINEEMKPKQLF